ncbi:unnamed protein product [Urochloa humidicola]
MDPVSLILLPRASRPFGTTAAPSRSTGLGSARVALPQRRRHRVAGRLPPVAAVAREAPLADEASAPPVSTEEQFYWLDQWYPFAPVGELDPGAPHGKTVLGLTVVAWHACSPMPARTASRRSPRAASTSKAGSSAYTTGGASTAPAPASSFPKHRRSARRCTRTAGRAWLRTRKG